MKTLVLMIAVIAALTQSAAAMCVGSETIETCTDDSGNTYNIQRLGNTTYMQGSNAQTGSEWSQQSTTLGNTTIHNGVDKEGESWTTTCVGDVCN